MFILKESQIRQMSLSTLREKLKTNKLYMSDYNKCCAMVRLGGRMALLFGDDSILQRLQPRVQMIMEQSVRRYAQQFSQMIKCDIPNNGMMTHQFPMTCEFVSDSCAKVNQHRSLPVYELSIR